MIYSNMNRLVASLLVLGSTAALGFRVEGSWDAPDRGPEHHGQGTGGQPHPPLPRPRLRILAGGDVTLGHHLAEFLKELQDRGIQSHEELQRYPFRQIAPSTRAADIFWVNLEGTLTHQVTPTPKNFNFRADPEDVGILLDAGVDVVCLANNHAFDYGPRGLQETRETLEQAGIASYGAGSNLSEARRPTILMHGGLRVGFLGYLYLGLHSVEPDSIFATTKQPGVAGAAGDLETVLSWVEQDVEALRDRVDLLLVSFHWGREGHLLVDPVQRRLARTAAAAGADVVVGHHPHNLQGYQRFGHTMVAYSLGNLVFGGNWNPARKESALLQIDASGKPPKNLKVQFRFLPLRLDRLPASPFQPYFLNGEAAEEVQRMLECSSHAETEGECEQPPQERPAATP